ncbi:MAG: hypothetical protein WB696_10485 [Chthoniobacterales bacterium]
MPTLPCIEQNRIGIQFRAKNCIEIAAAAKDKQAEKKPATPIPSFPSLKRPALAFGFVGFTALNFAALQLVATLFLPNGLFAPFAAISRVSGKDHSKGKEAGHQDNTTCFFW